MRDEEQEFVERIGRVAEADGLPRIAGRLMGFLLLREERYTLEELAEELAVSKASISTNGRLLEAAGMLERQTVPGDRRDYYALAEEPWERMAEVMQRRMRRFLEALREGQEGLPADLEVGRRRLRAWERFYEFLLDSIEEQVETWRERTSGDERTAR